MNYEEISELEEFLCKYCHCTEYGNSIGVQYGDPMHGSCEGNWCSEAYENYLNEDWGEVE